MVFNSTNPQNARWAILILVFIAAVALILAENQSFYRDFRSYFSEPANKTESASRLTIDFGDGTRRAFEGQVAAGMTILLALRASEEAGHFSAITDERGRIVAIAGIEQERDRRKWNVYLNQAPVNDAPGNVELKPGDKIMLRYE